MFHISIQSMLRYETPVDDDMVIFPLVYTSGTLLLTSAFIGLPNHRVLQSKRLDGVEVLCRSATLIRGVVPIGL
jgi:hypothetical protein